MPTVDQRLQRMTQALNLSDDQQQKIKPILENESTQMQSLRADTSLSQEDRMAKMKQIRENTSSQINPILNADQQKTVCGNDEPHGPWSRPRASSAATSVRNSTMAKALLTKRRASPF